MSKPDYSHAKKILTALEEGKTINVITAGSVEVSRMNTDHDYRDSLSLMELNNPKRYQVAKEIEYVPLTCEDIPATCWINIKPTHVDSQLVNYIGFDTIRYGVVSRHFTELMTGSYYYSKDRKNWKLMRKEKE